MTQTENTHKDKNTHHCVQSENENQANFCENLNEMTISRKQNVVAFDVSLLSAGSATRLYLSNANTLDSWRFQFGLVSTWFRKKHIYVTDLCKMAVVILAYHVFQRLFGSRAIQPITYVSLQHPPCKCSCKCSSLVPVRLDVVLLLPADLCPSSLCIFLVLHSRSAMLYCICLQVRVPSSALMVLGPISILP